MNPVARCIWLGKTDDAARFTRMLQASWLVSRFGTSSFLLYLVTGKPQLASQCQNHKELMHVLQILVSASGCFKVASFAWRWTVYPNIKTRQMPLLDWRVDLSWSGKSWQAPTSANIYRSRYTSKLRKCNEHRKIMVCAVSELSQCMILVLQASIAPFLSFFSIVVEDKSLRPHRQSPNLQGTLEANSGWWDRVQRLEKLVEEDIDVLSQREWSQRSL